MRIHSVGGYSEVGRNMTVVEVGDEAVILDMGLHLENYIRLTEEEDIVKVPQSKLIEEEAVPDISAIDGIRKKVRAIVVSHAHLDHVGGVPWLSNRFNAKIIGTPFTIEVLKAILRDEKIRLRNELVALSPNSSMKLSNSLKVEFIQTTHSTPQTAIVCLHTKEGRVLYANDFKFDPAPVMGPKPNLRRLRKLGRQGVKALVVDSTYSKQEGKMPSESIAREMLRETLLKDSDGKRAIVVTTFSSHIARLRSIAEFGRKMGRRVVFLGRSLSKYSFAAENAGISQLSKEAEIVRYSNRVGRRIKQLVRDGIEKYLLVVTGHQGEPKAVLTKMSENRFALALGERDKVVFSCKTIPTPTNIENRSHVERVLTEEGVEVVKDVHVSGHAAGDDIKNLIDITKPEWVVPAHGPDELKEGTLRICESLGYDRKRVPLLKNREVIEV